MIRKSFRWVRRHRKLAAALALLVLLVMVNAVAYMHAHAMTHFSPDGPRTGRPESLSFLAKAKILFTGVHIPKPRNDCDPGRFGMPFEVHHFSTPDGIDLESWYVPCPDAKGLVVLFHGYASSKAAVLPEAGAFRELGYATLLVDFRGSGGSDGFETTIGYKEAGDVAAAAAYAAQHWPGSPLILYGKSMGSAAILRALAVGGVQADAIVIEEPFDRLLSTVENRFTAMRLPSFPFARLLVFWGGAQHGYSGFAHNPIDYAPRVSCPVLLLHGANDRRVSKDQAHAVFDRFPGPKHFEVFPETEHGVLYAANPSRWSNAVGEFLAASGK